MRRGPTRRDFLRIAGASALAVPAGAGYLAYRSARGDAPPFDLLHRAEAGGVRVTTALSGTSPILLLLPDNATNPFGAYLGEILRAEGLNCFHVAPLSAATSRTLEPYDIALLAEGSLDTEQVSLLEGYVFRGGRLVCMRPDARLASLFGIESLPGTVSEGYVRVTPDHPVGAGIATGSLQFHGTADRYRLEGAKAVAWLSAGAEWLDEYPAVTIREFGDGHAAMWAFDLARSVAYMRQGNPARANVEQDGLDGVRTVDMFKGWIDLDRIAIPQADEQQRLLGNLLSTLSAGARPLPRLWYFPGRAPGMLVATGDSHMNPAPFIEEVLALVERRGGHMSVYYSPLLVGDWQRALRRARFFASDHVPALGKALAGRFGSPTPQMVDRWRARGHEFTLHAWVEAGLEEGWRRYWREFTGRGYGPVTSTTRTHRILWSGWVETARVQASCGVGMNLDYYHVGPSLKSASGEWVYGHLTGSGLPMKFVDERGRILAIYQQNTQLTDEHLLAMDVPGWGGWPDLSAEEATELSRVLLRRSVENGGYSAIAAQFHVDPFQVGGAAATKARRWMEGTLDLAVDLGLPIWSASDWLRFTRTRHDATFENIEWDPSARRASMRLVASSEEPLDLAVLVPLSHDGKRLSRVEVDGAAVACTERYVGGVVYASASVSAQGHQLSVVYQ